MVLKIGPLGISDLEGCVHLDSTNSSNVTYSPSELAALRETSSLALCARDTRIDPEKVVGYIAVWDDVCCIDTVGQTAVEGSSWLQQAAARSAKTCSDVAYIRRLSVDPDAEAAATEALIKETFLALAHVNCIMLATSWEVGLQQPGLAALFVKVAMNPAHNLWLYQCHRRDCLIPLEIRRAREEDHDELLPLLDRSSLLHPALAKLPESCRPDEPYALARVIASQDAENAVLVASVHSRLVGFMVVSTDVDVSSLQEAFDLQAYDGFLPADVYEGLQSAARETIAMRRAREHAQQQDHEDGQGQEAADVQQQGAATTPGPPEIDELELRAEIADILRERSDSFTPEVIAVTMLCMDEPWAGQAVEILPHLFDLFPSKAYTLVTLPHMAGEPPLLQSMTRVAPLPGSAFPEMLYLYNRFAMVDEFQVRAAMVKDVPEFQELLDGDTAMLPAVEVFRAAVATQTAFVAVAAGQLVAACTINQQVDMKMIGQYFDISSALHEPRSSTHTHAEIDLYVINPVFHGRSRQLLAAVMKLRKCTSLYYALPPGQQPPDILHLMQQVPPRHRSMPADAAEASFALFVFSKCSAFVRKTVINAQVVVVGASECGLSVVEALLLDTALKFGNITLLAPGGICIGGIGSAFTKSSIARMGLDAQVFLLNGEMHGLERASRTITLSDGTVLSYSLLLICAGIQDQSKPLMQRVLGEHAADMVIGVEELSAEFTLVDAEALNTVVVYGSDVSAFTALGVLDARGARGKFRFVAPPPSESPLTSLVKSIASKMGLDSVMEPEPAEIVAAFQRHETNEPVLVLQSKTLEGATRQEEVACDLLVGCTERTIHPALFQCLNDSSLVYDGRLVVDASFATIDRNIYAAGSIAKFSKQYRDDLLLEHYNSRECGQRLAESISKLFRGVPGTGSPPKLTAGKVVGCKLPGGHHFMLAGMPTALMHPTLDLPKGWQTMQTASKKQFVHLALNPQRYVHSILYLGSTPWPSSKVQALVGLPATYLNGLVEKWDNGKVPDLAHFLMQPWVDALSHDMFPAVREQILEGQQQQHSGQDAQQLHGVKGTVCRAMEAQMLRFLQGYSNDFPACDTSILSA